MHLTGDYISNSSEFSSSRWLATMDYYLDKIQNDLTSDNWTAIYQGLHHLNESHVQADQVQTSANLSKSNLVRRKSLD